MLPLAEVKQGVEATVVLWSLSGAGAALLALAFVAGSLSGRPWLRIASRAAVNVSRGVPTSLLVIAAGLTALRLPSVPQLPTLFPGTNGGFQHVAWAIAFALAFGSAGHLAEIFRAAVLSLGKPRLDQSRVLGLSWAHQHRLLARECAAVALAPAGARLVHHLHNTAFASLFPVVELFGFLQGQINATFQVFRFAALGCAIYVVLSGLTWLAFRAAEAVLAPTGSRTGGARAPTW